MGGGGEWEYLTVLKIYNNLQNILTNTVKFIKYCTHYLHLYVQSKITTTLTIKYKQNNNLPLLQLVTVLIKSDYTCGNTTSFLRW